MAETAEKSPQSQQLEVRLAQCSSELDAAFRLRYEVFVEEEKNLVLRNASRLETDAYDAACDHLIVKDLEADRVVGTYRLLPGDRASEGIGFYSETEFDLSAFPVAQPHVLELGRSCVAADYRNGRTIQLLWEGIARYLAGKPYQVLIGCASVHFRTQGDLHEVYAWLRHKGILTDRYGVRPLDTHRIVGLEEVGPVADEKEAFRKLPPLMKGYQWLGAEIGGDPAFDPVFDTVDFLVVLHQDRISRRYRRHFLNG